MGLHIERFLSSAINFQDYNVGIFVRERKQCCFNLDKFITKESQQRLLQLRHANIIN